MFMLLTQTWAEKTMEHNLVLVDLKPYHTKCGEDLRQSGLKIVWSCFERKKNERTAWTFNHVVHVNESDTELGGKKLGA